MFYNNLYKLLNNHAQASPEHSQSDFVFINMAKCIAKLVRA